MGGSPTSSPPEHPWEGLGASASSLASENPYATIKELPPAPGKAHEGSYMEMKSPVQREMSYAEIGLLEEPQEGMAGDPLALGSGDTTPVTGAAQPWEGCDPGDRAVCPKRDIGDEGLHDPGGNVSPCSLFLSLQRVVLKGLKAPLTESSPATTTPPRTATSPVTMTCHLPATTPRPHHCAGRTAEEPCRPRTNHEGTEDP